LRKGDLMPDTWDFLSLSRVAALAVDGPVTIPGVPQDGLKQVGILLRLATIAGAMNVTTSALERANGVLGELSSDALQEWLTHLMTASRSKSSLFGNSITLSRVDNRVLIGSRRYGNKGAEGRRLLIDALGVPKQLPALDDIMPFLRSHFLPLERTAIVAHQHILGSIVPQFAALIDLGCESRDILVMGKPYSTNEAAVESLRMLGCCVDGSVEAFNRKDISSPDAHQVALTGHLQGVVTRFLADVRSHGITKLIVIDDGGFIISMLDQILRGVSGIEQATVDFVVAGVEQTTAGSRRVQRLLSLAGEKSPFMSIIDVARSRSKLRYESPFIAQSVIDETLSYRRSVGKELPNGSVVGVAGFGAVGAWVAAKVREGQHGSHRKYSLLIYDGDYSKQANAEAAGFDVADSFDELVQNSYLVIGCTGSTLPEIDVSLLRGVKVLASASSWNYEFSHFLKDVASRGSPIPHVYDGPQTNFDWLHSIARCQYKQSEVFILNSGFPVNFTGGVDPIAVDRIQLTRCLMVAGALQAAESLSGDAGSAPGRLRLRPLYSDAQEEVLRACQYR
jgi:S-adenosylhomocysteine hydrolase